MEKTEINNVQFAEEPQAILYMLLPSGEADVFLHRNIRQETDEDGAEIWTAEEAQFRTTRTRDEIVKDFDGYFTPQLTTEQQIAQLQADVKTFSRLVTTETTQSDKLGYDWKITKIGNLEAKKEYVEQQNPAGTRDSPIAYYDGVPLIDNAYYLKDGKRQVYMAGTWTEF